MPTRSRLARWLQCSCLLQVCAALVWLAWRWPASPTQAVAGAVAVPLIAPMGLAVELLIMSRVCRRDRCVPHPSSAQLARAWWRETCYLFRTFWWRQPFRWAAIADQPDACAGKTPVVLVHGFLCNRGFWTPWMQELHAHGHPFVAVNLEPVFGRIEAYVDLIDDAVMRASEATGRMPLIVSHSMGGLAVRAWWRAMRGQRPVARVVTIATPHAGTWLGRFSTQPNGRQMHLRSEWLRRLSADEATQPLPAVTCWYSNCDNVVFPPSTATLPGADNRFVPGEPHVALAFHRAVLQDCLAVLAALDAQPSSKSVTSSGPLIF